MRTGLIDCYFIYRRSTLKGHIASNNLFYIMYMFDTRLKTDMTIQKIYI